MRRLRVLDELVCQVSENARGRSRFALGDAGDDGTGVPYAIGAKFAHPDRPVIALVGDGAMQMNGLAELLTISRYYDKWLDPRMVICVFHNNDLNQVTWELRAMGGYPKFENRRPSRTSPTLTSRGAWACRRSLSTTPTNSAGVGFGAVGGRADRSRRAVRPRGPADPAARHLRAGQGSADCLGQG